MRGPRRIGRPASSLTRRSHARIRLGVRIAAKNALRARGRSILIVALVALPVFGLTAAGTVALSATGTVAQHVQARLGGMAAEFDVEAGRVEQTPDGEAPSESGSVPTATPRKWVPEKWRIVPLQQAQLFLRTAHGVADIEGEAGRSWDDAFAGRFTVASGRAPTSANELLVTPAALARFDTHVGGTIRSADGTRRYTVVGTMEDLTVPSGTAMVFGTFAAFPGLSTSPGSGIAYYLAGPPVTWSDVLAFNRHGALVQSRAVTAGITTPDANTAWTLIAIFAIIGAFMLVEIALLSGAAFMVGARQQQRALAVLASVGADRRVLRTSIAAGGVVLGAAGALIGIGLGLLGAWAYMTATTDGSTTKYYGFDASPVALVVLGIVAVAAAWVSAAIPGRAASRFDVVAALRGARRPAEPSRWRSAIGVVLVIIGAAMIAAGGVLTLLASTQNPPGRWLQASGPTLLVIGSIGLQVGAILGLPAVLRAASAWMARLGSGARMATRDLARNSARSVPAIAVIMSTAFVGVFLILVVTGAEAAGAASYPWAGPLHSARIQFLTDQGTGDPAPRPVSAATASAYAAEANRVLGTSDARVIDAAPDATVYDPESIKPGDPAIPEPRLNPQSQCAYEEGDRSCAIPQFLSSDGEGAKLIVGDTADLTAMLGQRPSAEAVRALESGGAVSLYPEYLTGRHVTIAWWTPKQLSAGENIIGSSKPQRSQRLDAVVDAPEHPGAFGVVVSAQTAARLGVSAQPRFVLVDRRAAPSDAQQDALNAYILQKSGAGGQPQADLAVEMGPSHAAGGITWLIVAIAALCTLASAVIALSLARIDGRRDESTLIAVGARPRTQRLIAFWQALVLAGLGSLVGSAFALIPSAALAFAHTIAFSPPWSALVVGAVGVPLLIALVASAIRRAPRSVAPDRALVA